ncbi:hypothetical protein J4Q44_G00276900 [Coregonus suidteri]|uniref:Uncharacterized protein n=1 Tax=Coregonus suidteri TaxID=861788 RepID=A0AAN8KZ66_9TELE
MVEDDNHGLVTRMPEDLHSSQLGCTIVQMQDDVTCEGGPHTAFLEFSYSTDLLPLLTDQGLLIGCRPQT